MADAWKRLTRGIRSACQRAEQQPDEHGLRAAANITELRKLRRLIEELIDVETIRGRGQGASWWSLGSSKQQAQ